MNQRQSINVYSLELIICFEISLNTTIQSEKKIVECKRIEKKETRLQNRTLISTALSYFFSDVSPAYYFDSTDVSSFKTRLHYARQNVSISVPLNFHNDRQRTVFGSLAELTVYYE